MRRRHVVIFAALAVMALGAGVAWRHIESARARSATAAAEGATLLALALPDLAGADQPLAQWKGRILVVNFWATWCEPCREEMPRFVTLQRELGEKGLQFVGIAIDQPQKTREFASEIDLNYPTLIGGYGAIELSKSFGNQVGALPFTLVLDRTGRVVQSHLGPINDQQLRATINKLL